MEDPRYLRCPSKVTRRRPRRARRAAPGVDSNRASVFLPTDGCFVASSEVELFRVEGEAVILSFPMFSRVLQVRRIAPSWAKVTIAKSNGSASAEDEERVLQSNKQLWFLPVKASDSGEYTCTYRCALKQPWRQRQRVDYPVYV